MARLDGPRRADAVAALLGGSVDVRIGPEGGVLATWAPGTGWTYGVIFQPVEAFVREGLQAWGIGAGQGTITLLGPDGPRVWWGSVGDVFHETYVVERWWARYPTRHTAPLVALLNAVLGSDPGYARDLAAWGRAARDE